VARIYNKKTFSFSLINKMEIDINLNFNMYKAEKYISWKPSHIDKEILLEMSNEFSG